MPHCCSDATRHCSQILSRLSYTCIIFFSKNGGTGLKSRRKVFDFNSFRVPRRCGTGVEQGWNGVEQDFEMSAVNIVMIWFIGKWGRWLFHAMHEKAGSSLFTSAQSLSLAVLNRSRPTGNCHRPADHYIYPKTVQIDMTKCTDCMILR